MSTKEMAGGLSCLATPPGFEHFCSGDANMFRSSLQAPDLNGFICGNARHCFPVIKTKNFEHDNRFLLAQLAGTIATCGAWLARVGITINGFLLMVCGWRSQSHHTSGTTGTRAERFSAAVVHARPREYQKADCRRCRLQVFLTHRVADTRARDPAP